MVEKEKIAAVLAASTSWDDVINGLKSLGLSYVRKGGGAVVKSADGEMKASDVGREFSLYYMEKRLGPMPGNTEKKSCAAAGVFPRKELQSLVKAKAIGEALMVEKEKIAEILSLGTWDDVINELKALGLSYVRKGGGAVVKSAYGEIKASDIGRKFSLFYMEKRLGPMPETVEKTSCAASGALSWKKPEEMAKDKAVSEVLMVGKETVAAKLKLGSWDGVVDGLASLGLSYDCKAGGAVIKSANGEIKASDIGKEFSLLNMEKRLGPVLTGAITAEKEKIIAIIKLGTWEDVFNGLKSLGFSYVCEGGIVVIKSPDGDIRVSGLGGYYSIYHMEKRLGPVLIDAAVFEKENMPEKEKIATKLRLGSWKDVFNGLKSIGLSYVPIGGTAVIKSADGEIRASIVGREFSLYHMERRLGPIVTGMTMIEQEEIAAILALGTWNEVLSGLESLGLSYVRKGDGAVIKFNGGEITASSVGGEFGLSQMEQRLGPMPDACGQTVPEVAVSKTAPKIGETATPQTAKNAADALSWETLEAKATASKRARILRAVLDGDAETVDRLCDGDYEADYLAERYELLVSQKRKALPDSSVCEMWIREKRFDKVRGNGRPNDIYREPEEAVFREYFGQYQAALEAESFEVICVSPENRKMPFHALEGYPDGIPADLMPERFGKLLYLTHRGEMIGFRPLSSRFHYIFVHYVSVRGLANMYMRGVVPAYIQQIGPAIFQAIIKIPKTGNREADRIIETDMSRALNLLAGDCMPGSRRPHYAPGFTNWRGEAKDGLFPLAAPVTVDGAVCEGLAEYGWWALEHRPAPIVNEFVPEKPVAPEESAQVDGTALYDAHLRDLLRIKAQKLAEADHSQVDMMIATRLRGTGHDENEVAGILAEAGRKTRPDKHNWEDYSRRTARKAFSDDRLLLKLSGWIEKWRELELQAVCLPQRAGAMT